jgi:hypothetical protein
MIQNLANHIKNIRGQRVNRKLIAFSVDDYGNIRISNKDSLNSLKLSGIKLTSRFDHFDALENKIDYEMLFDALSCVKDLNGKPAVFSTYALTSNTDFKKTIECGEYISEDLNRTYARLGTADKDYEGTFELLKEGIKLGLIRPQFHGREHLNVKLFNNLLKEKNKELLINIENQCLTGLPMHASMPNVSFNEAFGFWNKADVEEHKKIISDGLKRFQTVYGYDSITFTPPAQQIHPELYEFVLSQNVLGIDKIRKIQRHFGDGKYVVEKNRLGKAKSGNCFIIVRNCVFEPNDRKIDWVNYTLKQIEAAFFWGKPAIISSHRVNFSGQIDPENRNKGLSVLRGLLNKIIKKWPDVEFVSVDELTNLVLNDK